MSPSIILSFYLFKKKKPTHTHTHKHKHIQIHRHTQTHTQTHTHMWTHTTHRPHKIRYHWAIYQPCFLNIFWSASIKAWLACRVLWVSGSSLPMNSLSYFSFQLVLHNWCNRGHVTKYVLSCVWDDAYKLLIPASAHNWCNKGCGMYYPDCAMMHIQDPFLLIKEERHEVVAAGFFSW